MTSLVNALAIVAMMATAIVLLIGLGNFFRGGSPSFSNRMMQMRILMQAIAVVLLVGGILIARG